MQELYLLVLSFLFLSFFFMLTRKTSAERVILGFKGIEAKTNMKTVQISNKRRGHIA